MGLFLCPGAVLLAAATATNAPPETKRMDATCDAATKLDDGHKLLRIFADVSEAVDPQANDGRGKWREFKSDAAFKAYATKNDAPNTQARIWRAPDGTTIAGMYFQSDTGDWSFDVDYCFRPDGSLARLDSTIGNLAGGDSGERVTYYRADGSALFERAKAFDTDHKRLPDADDLDRAPVYPTVKSLPFLAPVGAAPPPVKPPAPNGAHADGGLNPATVASYVRQHLGPVKACYELELKKNATLSGKVVMHWTIDETGGTRAIDVERNTLGASDVGACLQSVIRKWQFTPPAGGNVDVSFPFVFQSMEGPTKRR